MKNDRHDIVYLPGVFEATLLSHRCLLVSFGRSNTEKNLKILYPYFLVQPRGLQNFVFKCMRCLLQNLVMDAKIEINVW